MSKQSTSWDLTSVFGSEDEWRVAATRVEQRARQLAQVKGSFSSSANGVLETLTEHDAICEKLAVVTTYASLRFYKNTRDAQATSLRSEGMALQATVNELFSFISPELLGLAPEVVAQYLNESVELKRRYGFYLAELERSRAHILSAKEEELLGKFSAVMPLAERIREALHDGDMRFSPLVLGTTKFDVSHGRIDELLQHSDRDVRQAAFNGYWSEYRRYAQTFGATLSAQAILSATHAQARHHASSLQEALFDDALPESVYRTVVRACREHYPLFHTYFRAKAKLLGQSKLAESDLFAKLSLSAPKISFDGGVDLTLAALSPLGDEYVEIARQGICKEHWADVYPAEGKYSNAFSSGTSGTKPYFLLNFAPNFTEVGTFAHELGHSMHSYLTIRAQPYVYHGYAMSVAETASNLNQVLLREHVLQDRDVESSLAVLDEAFYFAHRYLFMMPTLSRVEHVLHMKAANKSTLNAKELQRCTVTAFRAAYGDAVSFEPELTGVKWASFCHFYMPYYLFQYAIGISSAMSIGRRLVANEVGLREKYLRFLSVGSSMPVLEIFRLVDLDITSIEMYRDAFKVVEGYVERLEKLARSGLINT